MAEQSIIEQVSVQEKVVAFTFDDGPHPVYTPQVLDIFRRAGGHATFFMIGEEMEAHPDIAAEVHREGHEIANHTYTHPNLTELTLEEAGEELRRAEQLVQKVTGGSARSFRPPYFGVNDDILALAAERGYRTIGAANGAARDWDNPGTQHIVEHSRSAVKPGSVLIFHDGYGDRSQTVEAVRVLVEELTADGYRLVTVSELLDM
ncbi:polysaccharide deacetylase family protein [Paenibacillus silvae]|uniref:polysaccharide deacetylase family protein n=1 Tax=Paenibacillus silvae TaxID=1325358 RepID=UPI002006CE94|nr:polysaccharide deacetylase family protein [Paenibacillus silvae]MCK6077675.1 polysaccharide deacetylase family protein [Paenibacillus silvae]MCK6151875.1 polysaccharide deacetylase family protein [Paenibacillus silvae]MCK6270559.1 polysaccharide deacetylase family protein [Paenibacillus silvae]